VEVITVILLKSRRPIRRATVFLKGAAVTLFLDQSAGYAVYAVWERAIPKEGLTGYAITVVRNSVSDYKIHDHNINDIRADKTGGRLSWTQRGTTRKTRRTNTGVS
jgi:hypothetical protein